MEAKIIHWSPFKGSPETACGRPYVKHTRNINRVTCKTCLNSKWPTKNKGFRWFYGNK